MKSQHMSKDEIMKIARELNRTKTIQELVTELGVSDTTIRKIACELRKKGVAIPKGYLHDGIIDQAVRELRTSEPELFMNVPGNCR